MATDRCRHPAAPRMAGLGGRGGHKFLQPLQTFGDPLASTTGASRCGLVTNTFAIAGCYHPCRRAPLTSWPAFGASALNHTRRT